MKYVLDDSKPYVKIDYENRRVYINPETGSSMMIGAKEYYSDLFEACKRKDVMMTEDNLRICRKLGICE